MRGSIKITIGTRSGNENTLAELEKGEFFGELALFDDEPRSANAIAIEDSYSTTQYRNGYSSEAASVSVIVYKCPAVNES